MFDSSEEYVEGLEDKVSALQEELDKYKLIASGKVTVYVYDGTVIVGDTVITDDGMTMELFNKFEGLNGKQISIYVKEVEFKSEVSK